MRELLFVSGLVLGFALVANPLTLEQLAPTEDGQRPLTQAQNVRFGTKIFATLEAVSPTFIAIRSRDGRLIRIEKEAMERIAIVNSENFKNQNDIFISSGETPVTVESTSLTDNFVGRELAVVIAEDPKTKLRHVSIVFL